MKIGLVGHGVVGSGVEKIIASLDSDIQIVKILTRSPRGGDDQRFTTDAAEFAATDFDVLVECAGGTDTALTLALDALAKGRPLVTSNKMMLATHYQQLMQAAQAGGAQIRYDATTAGGVPWLRNLQLLRRTDRLESFAGIFNGTSNFILDAMESAGLEFESALAKARELGYAEADPSDDLSGRDVRYKTALSINTGFGGVVDPNQIPMFGVENVTAADIWYAADTGLALRLIGRASRSDLDGTVSASVMPELISRSSLFANTGKNNNCIEAVSTNLGRSAFFGQGAGSAPTAFAMVQDLLDLATPIAAFFEPLQVVDDGQTHRYYLRANSDLANSPVGAKLRAIPDTRAFITGEITLTQLLELTDAITDKSLFVARIVN